MDQTFDGLKALALADDFTIVRAFEHFHGRLVRALGTPLADLARDVEANAAVSASVKSLLASLQENETEELREDQSVAVARELLVAAASAPECAALVRECLENWTDDRKSVGRTLSVGLVGAVWLLICTTKVTFKGEHVTVEKQPIPVDQVQISGDRLRGTIRFQPASPRSNNTPVPTRDLTVPSTPATKPLTTDSTTDLAKAPETAGPDEPLSQK